MSANAVWETWKLTKKQVTPTEKLFLLSCADRADEDGYVNSYMQILCKDTCLSMKEVIAIEKSLIKKGLITEDAANLKFIINYYDAN